MDVLSNEVLMIIIGFLDKNDLLTVRLLNKTWEIYAEEQLKSKYFSIKKDEDILNLIRTTSWRKFLSSPFVRFNINPEISQKVLVQFSNLYGSRIQGLRFEEKITAMEYLNKMAQLLMTTPNIEEAYFKNIKYCDFFKDDYKLNLPKLRIVEFSRMDTDHIMLINRASGIKEIRFNGLNFEVDPRFRMKDFITILESIGRKGIEVKHRMFIQTNYGRNTIQTLKIMTDISFKMTELALSIILSEANMRDLTPMQELIEQLIHKHSQELKYLRIECYTKEKLKEELKLTLNLSNMLNLEKLELFGRYLKPGVKLEVNLGVVPILKEIRITYSELTFGSVPSLKSLAIESRTADEHLNKFRLIEDTFQLEKLSLIYSLVAIPQTSIQQLNNFLISQAKELKELRIVAQFSYLVADILELPKIIKLKRLELDLDSERNNKVVHPLQFPYLEFLNLNASFYQCCSGMEYVHTLILGWKSFDDIEKGGLSFPNLRKLQVPDPDYLLLTTNKYMIHVEELYLNQGGTYKDITGISGDKHLLEEVSNLNGNILNNSNLGKMIALKRLVIGGIGKDSIKAVAFLISCGKLPNLKYFEATISKRDKRIDFTIP